MIKKSYYSLTSSWFIEGHVGGLVLNFEPIIMQQDNMQLLKYFSFNPFMEEIFVCLKAIPQQKFHFSQDHFLQSQSWLHQPPCSKIPIGMHTYIPWSISVPSSQCWMEKYAKHWGARAKQSNRPVLKSKVGHRQMKLQTFISQRVSYITASFHTFSPTAGTESWSLEACRF